MSVNFSTRLGVDMPLSTGIIHIVSGHYMDPDLHWKELEEGAHCEYKKSMETITI